MKGKVVLLSIGIAASIAITLSVGIVGFAADLGSKSSSISTISSTSVTSQQMNSTGTLAILITDPSIIPNGVTAVYFNYSKIEIHASGTNNQSGWEDLPASGALNLLAVLNSTETIAAVNISSGLFNSIRFNMTSVFVTFQNENYSAYFENQKHTLVLPIVGGIDVKGGQTSGALIEMMPTILLVGNDTDPAFAFIPEARGFVLPALSVSIHPKIGDRDDYTGNITSEIHDLTHFRVSSSVLTPDSVSIAVENTGAAMVILRVVALTCGTTVSEGWVPSLPLAPTSNISEFFIVAPNASLIPLTASANSKLIETVAQAGFSLAPHQNETFSYSGALYQGDALAQNMSFGEHYVLTVLASDDYVRALEKASQLDNGGTTTIKSTNSISSSQINASAFANSSGLPKAKTDFQLGHILSQNVGVYWELLNKPSHRSLSQLQHPI